MLSWFAYPASEAYRDISKHGSAQDEDEMDDLILLERMEGRVVCTFLLVRRVG